MSDTEMFPWDVAVMFAMSKSPGNANPGMSTFTMKLPFWSAGTDISVISIVSVMSRKVTGQAFPEAERSKVSFKSPWFWAVRTYCTVFPG